jgi:hypothetical protein
MLRAPTDEEGAIVGDRVTYQDTLAAMGACVASRIPFLLWGEPGAGKTAVVESAAAAGWHVETLICSHYEPSDFAGLPIVQGDHVTMAPPGWARRVSSEPRPSLVFFDEWTTASPAVQAAALRPLTHAQVGALQLPDRVCFGAAANPADVAASGWELAAPTANRFVHLDWSMPLEVYTESLVSGDWPAMPVPELPADFERLVVRHRAGVAGFLRSRAGQLSAIPSDAASRGRAFPTPRTWDMAARLLAVAEAGSLTAGAERLLVYGAVGPPVGHELLVWLDALDLPDPEDLLADPTGPLLKGLRPDRVYVALQGVLGVVGDDDPERWSAAMSVCVTAAGECGIDSAVPVVRSLLRPGRRPPGAALPDIGVFAPALRLAGLVP